MNDLISAKTYAIDAGKSHQLINRYLRNFRELPGVLEYKHIDGLGYVLKAGPNYRNIVAKIKKQKYLEVMK